MEISAITFSLLGYGPLICIVNCDDSTLRVKEIYIQEDHDAGFGRRVEGLSRGCVEAVGKT